MEKVSKNLQPYERKNNHYIYTVKRKQIKDGISIKQHFPDLLRRKVMHLFSGPLAVNSNKPWQIGFRVIFCWWGIAISFGSWKKGHFYYLAIMGRLQISASQLQSAEFINGSFLKCLQLADFLEPSSLFPCLCPSIHSISSVSTNSLYCFFFFEMTTKIFLFLQLTLQTIFTSDQGILLQIVSNART